METGPIRRRRALTPEGARNVRQRGYDDALEFALAIGLSRDYQNDHLAKKDVIDPSGDAHSVKGGVKKWQVFLYGKLRFESDDAFAVMNGIGALLVECIDSFPQSYEEYQSNKQAAKERLRIPMRELAEKLQNPKRLRAFLEKSLFNGKEVSYLTVKQDGLFHVFRNKDVVQVFGECLEVCNSKALYVGQTPEQKVLFRYNGKNLGELEMRNDSPRHYRQVRFNMIKPKVVELLFTKIPVTWRYNNLVLVHGGAAKIFGRWR
jgi:hypothetical protein